MLTGKCTKGKVSFILSLPGRLSELIYVNVLRRDHLSRVPLFINKNYSIFYGILKLIWHL